MLFYDTNILTINSVIENSLIAIKSLKSKLILNFYFIF